VSISIDLLPVAVGFYNYNWFATTVTNVNDASDATYAGTNGGGALSYTLDPLPAGATQVISVTLKMRLSTTTNEWNGIFHGKLLHAGSLLAGFSFHPEPTAVTEQSALIVKSNGTVWTPAEVDALEAYLDVTADDGFDYHAPNEGRYHRGWLTVVYNDVPPAPSSLTAVVTSSSQVDLAWTDNSVNETSFRVERADGPGGAYASIATPAADAVTYSDTTVKNNTLYSYRIFAVNASGDSEPSNVATVSVGVIAPDQASFSEDLALARFEVLKNVVNHGYRAGEIVGLVAIRFDIGAGEIGPINFNMAAYDNTAALAAGVQAAIRTAIGGGDTTGLCTFSESTHLITVGRSAGTFNILIDTGDDAYKDMAIWPHLGFNRGADKTGAASYVADLPLFEGADKDHILLASFNGFRDDASGTYTGSANVRIEKSPDVARVLIERYGPLPVSKIDTASFVAGRSHLPSAVMLFVWIQEREPLEKILERIENSALSHIVMDSEGSVHYVPYSDTTVRRAFFDRDFLSFRAHKVKSSVFKGVRLHYGIHPHNGRRDAIEWTSTEADVLHSTKELKQVETYIRDKTDAETAAAMHGALATAAPIEVEFTSRSKLVDLKLADVIELTRDRCTASPTGALAAVKFKIAELRHNYGTGVSYCYAVQQITLT
jgi:hypothetical protein